MRFPPRFSGRTLAIIVIAIVAYFAMWGLTIRYARYLAMNSGPYGRVVNSAGSPAPLIIYCDEYFPYGETNTGGKRHYYLWLLGPMIPPVSDEETKLVLVHVTFIILICSLIPAWRSNRIGAFGIALSLVIFVIVSAILFLPSVQ
jgi:hypothetical protein